MLGFNKVSWLRCRTKPNSNTFFYFVYVKLSFILGLVTISLQILNFDSCFWKLHKYVKHRCKIQAICESENLKINHNSVLIFMPGMNIYDFADVYITWLQANRSKLRALRMHALQILFTALKSLLKAICVNYHVVHQWIEQFKGTL